MVHEFRRLLRGLCTRRQRPQLRPQRPHPAPAGPDVSAPAHACGWFDSSHELRTGLTVEEAPGSEAPPELSLGDWLRLELREWRGGPVMRV